MSGFNLTATQRNILKIFPIAAGASGAELATSLGKATNPIVRSANGLIAKGLLSSEMTRLDLKMYKLTAAGKKVSKELGNK